MDQFSVWVNSSFLLSSSFRWALDEIIVPFEHWRLGSQPVLGQLSVWPNAPFGTLCLEPSVWNHKVHCGLQRHQRKIQSQQRTGRKPPQVDCHFAMEHACCWTHVHLILSEGLNMNKAPFGRASGGAMCCAARAPFGTGGSIWNGPFGQSSHKRNHSWHKRNHSLDLHIFLYSSSISLSLYCDTCKTAKTSRGGNRFHYVTIKTISFVLAS